MKVIMRLNTWANICGHFFNCCLTPGCEDKPDVNNGYNCDHPDAEEADGIGCCFAHSCPLAYRADGLDCQRFGVRCEDCGNEDCECDDDMMVCEIPVDKYDEQYMYRSPRRPGRYPMFDNDRIAADRAVIDGATAGPYEKSYDFETAVVDSPHNNSGEPLAMFISEADANFFIAARIGWPEALDEVERLRSALAQMWFAYENKDGEYPHDFETRAVESAQKLLGAWVEAMKLLHTRKGASNE